MNSRGTLVLAAAALAVGGCSPTVDVPATAPTTTIAPSSTASTAPASATSTTTEATTSTTDRIAEITAIFEDLERRRLAAIYSGDVEGFTALFANEQYLELSMEAFAQTQVIDPDASDLLSFSVITDQPECIAATATRDYSLAIEGGGRLTTIVVIERRSDWGISWVGEGWQCDGPHPLSP